MTERKNRVFMVILAFFLPPLAVGVEKGFGASLFFNIILTLFGFFPGLIHALILVW
jgi:uncharacterized membrane protein YqaE (UPF0057 family)